MAAGGTCTQQQPGGVGWTRPQAWGRQPACTRPAWQTTRPTTVQPPPSGWQPVMACWAAKLLSLVRLLSSEPSARQCQAVAPCRPGPSGDTQAGRSVTVLIVRRPRDLALLVPGERRIFTTVTFRAAAKFMERLLT